MIPKAHIYKAMLIGCIAATSLQAYDFLLEFKGAYFQPTHHTFRQIYHGGAIYGPEATFFIYRNLYGFLSADFLNKKGNSIGFCTPTKVNLVNIGIGLKYFVPFCYGDFYAGLGILPTKLQTRDCSPYVIQNRSKWHVGGIAKFGVYVDLPACFILDLFINYSFVNVPFKKCCNAPTISHNANVSGVWFGGGLGYRF